jgi:hypothetical protein
MGRRVNPSGSGLVSRGSGNATGSNGCVVAAGTGGTMQHDPPDDDVENDPRVSKEPS